MKKLVYIVAKVDEDQNFKIVTKGGHELAYKVFDGAVHSPNYELHLCFALEENGRIQTLTLLEYK